MKHENAAHRFWGINLLYELQSNPEIGGNSLMRSALPRTATSSS